MLNIEVLMVNNTKYDLEERLIDFAVIIKDIVEALPDSRLGNYIAGQLIRSDARQL